MSLAALAVLALGWIGQSAAQQVTPDQAAAMVLNSARKAYNEKNYPFAVMRFREFLAKYGGHKDAPAARYGLALTLLAGPQKNYVEIRDLLQPLAGMKDWPEHPQVLYHLGLTQRGLGLQEWAIGQAKPQEANQRRDAARQRFEEARQHFAQALGAFMAKPEDVPPDAKELPVRVEWAARTRCNLAEMQLRVMKAKEAQATAAPFLKDPILSRSKYRDLGRYYHGFASFLLREYAEAEKSLSTLVPFRDPEFGPHARYLLARTHHLADERAEARLHYEGVLNDYARHKKEAAELLRQPAKFQNDPGEKERLEDLVRNPPPDHVVRAGFYLGVLLYEAGRFSDARAFFAQLPKQYPNSPLRLDAELRVGFCQVQLREFPEAIKTLTPLVDRDRRLSDQVLFWLAKAQVGAAPDPAANIQGYQQALNAAVNTFRQAAERAQQMAGMDPEARERQGEILLELADTQQLLKQYREAAGTYNQILNDKILPTRQEETSQRLIAALHLAGDFNESDKACARFQERFPQSPLLPLVLFRHAENSYFRALAAEKGDPKELARLRDETIKRYQVIIEKYPETPHINLARYSQGLTYYRKGELDKARKTLSAIPVQDRNNDLAVVPYVMADCLIRLAPKGVPEDALETSKLEEQLKTAADLLEGFTSSQPKGPQTADALLKLGLCQQRLATVLAQPADKAKTLASARASYERILSQFPGSPLQPQAVLERAKCMAQMGDPNGAVNELRRFTTNPLENAAAAPMGLIELATLLRGQNKAAEAAAILAKGRERHEGNLNKDPQRAGWIVLLRYHHGIALREAGKLPEARNVFDQVIKQAGNRPEAAESALRFGQCLKEEGEQKVQAARKALASTKKPEETAAALKLAGEGYKTIADAMQFLESQAEQWKQKQPALDARARMHYQAAWGHRLLADREVEAARALRVEALMKKLPKGTPPPEIPLSEIPVQPAEKKAEAQYRLLIAAFPDLPLATDARFELAELHADRGRFDDAVKLLNEGLDKEPPAELTEKIRLRLGAVHAAKGDLKAALAQFNAVAQNPKSALAGQGHYRAGECLMAEKQYAEAIKRFVLFRDQQPFQNLPGLSDRALLRLGQAYAQLNSWNDSRVAHERLVGAFPNSPWADDGRYGIGWAWQQQKQHDQAVNAYSQVTARTATETAAKAQLQIGLCRLEQKRFPEAVTALLVVPFTYDYPELSAAARLEAARCFVEMKQNGQAIRLLERLMRDHPNTRWETAARERLEAIRGKQDK
jgi:TolA-binding protein